MTLISRIKTKINPEAVGEDIPLVLIQNVPEED